jgi:uncharacterized secreted protein with C-terminal beta-propeller domain
MAACNANTVQHSEDFGLNSVKNEKQLKSLMKKKKSIFNGLFSNAKKSEAPADMESDNSSSTDYTKTNVQVEGVDEGDIVKTDGDRIYVIKYNQLEVVDVLNDGTMKLVLHETLGGDSTTQNNMEYYNSSTYFSSIYTTEDYLIVIGQKYDYYWNYTNKETNTYCYTNNSVILLYDIKTLTKVDEYSVSGHLLESRLIDNQLYLISNHYTYYNDDLDDLRPWITHDNETKYVEYEDIKYLEDMNYQSFTIITSVKLDEEPVYENDIFLGTSSWGIVYVSKESIYLATTVYRSTLFGGDSYKGMLISYQFDKSTGKVIYGGSGEFKGNVINQFAMDEYNGYMRVATTEGWGDSVKNRLYVFQRQLDDTNYVLKVVGSIEEGLGKPRERIQSVRFNKDKATVVTYEQKDPFYTIDLSDPTKPTIKGELIVTGYSVYQHPWTDKLVVGIGFESEENSVSGMKLALYDISDFENPTEVGKPLVISGNNWTYSEALYNHKAVMIDKDRGYIGFSIWKYNWQNNNGNINDYVVFNIDETKAEPIAIKYVVNHYKYYNTSDYNYNYNFEIKRGIRIDNYLYVVSGDVITSHNLVGEFGTVDEMIFVKEKVE